jgi:hypothetical protein
VVIATLRYAAALALDSQPLAGMREALTAIIRDPRSALSNRVTRSLLPSRLTRRNADADFLRGV